MYVAKKDRTAASALFVSLSAVGMALGPLLALPLSHMPSLTFLGLTFNDITMGGWVMTACWILFMVVAAVAFEEPLQPQAVPTDRYLPPDPPNPPPPLPLWGPSGRHREVMMTPSPCQAMPRSDDPTPSTCHSGEMIPLSPREAITERS
jgi:hypothetical protein